MRGPAVLLGVLLAAPAAPGAQDREASCPYCHGDAELMRAAGVVSHGPMTIGAMDSAALARDWDGTDWIFLETAHFRWASSLGPESLDAADQKRRKAEIEALRAALPDVPKQPRKLDPWLRLHLLSARAEAFYARFQALLRVTDADFPPERRTEGLYMGNGRFLGEKDKFELVVHARRATHLEFTQRYMGAQVTDSMRWHVAGQHKMLASIPAEDSDLRQDRWLWPHIVHNLAHLCFCAYKHFSFDPPAWLDEGLAHMLEREAEPLSFTREGEEGTYKERSLEDWSDRALRLARSDKAPALAVLLHRHTVGEMADEEHVAAWAIVRFMAVEHPERFAAFLGGIKGQLDEQGLPTGRDLTGLQTRLLRELWSWTPADLDAAWKAWALKAP